MKGKKITVSEIAKKANVSPATVSRVLHHREQVKESTIEHVEDAMISMGYSFDVSQVANPVNRPIIVINIPSFQNTFYQEIFKGAQSSAKAHGYEILIYDSPIDSTSIRDFRLLLQQVNAAGTLLLNPVKEDALYQIHNQLPMIQCCEYNANVDFPFVSVDDFLAAEIATEHLISCGRGKIALINGPSAYKYAVERQRGFLSALSKADISILNNWILHLPEINFEMAYTSTCRLLNAEIRPNAFFAVSDVYAAAAIKSANHFGFKVPQDIMVVGFDNIDLSQMTTPSITTMSQPRFQQGYSACELLIESIEHPNAIQRPLILNAELIVRESTSLSYRGGILK